MLRAAGKAEETRWWASAIQAHASAPPAVRAILTGRSRVEVSAEEAEAVLVWASALDGWDESATAPLSTYPAEKS